MVYHVGHALYLAIKRPLVDMKAPAFENSDENSSPVSQGAYAKILLGSRPLVYGLMYCGRECWFSQNYISCIKEPSVLHNGMVVSALWHGSVGGPMKISKVCVHIPWTRNLKHVLLQRNWGDDQGRLDSWPVVATRRPGQIVLVKSCVVMFAHVFLFHFDACWKDSAHNTNG
ncbi:hypothetical protein VNO78_08387 [Psophocarpus tetragonolobus]|uniref:Uncharacterized protein n=1 Tax=Psophocarpus tetragonolobus TaxID=3891 RepID=A0AAN9SX45_PSOTE